MPHKAAPESMRRPEILPIS